MATSTESWSGGRGARKLRRAAWLAMAAVTIFFVALTYAYVTRRGSNAAWMTPRLAGLLGINTALLLLSSGALARARQQLQARHAAGVLRWSGAALALGASFLLGQGLAWRQLLRAGIYGATRPDSGYFFLVTAAHAAHLAVALGLLAWVFTRAWRGRLPADRPLLLEVTAIVWHTLDAAWVAIFCVLLLYR